MAAASYLHRLYKQCSIARVMDKVIDYSALEKEAMLLAHTFQDRQQMCESDGIRKKTGLLFPCFPSRNPGSRGFDFVTWRESVLGAYKHLG